MTSLRSNELGQYLALVLQQVAAAEGPPHITANVLILMADIFHCQWATYWQVDPVEMRLRPEVIWNHHLVRTSELDRDTRDRTLSLSEGTAGHVWRTRRPVWTTNLALDMCLPRSLDAQDAGLRGGVWFAVKTDEAVYGVVEMLGLSIPASSEETLIMVEQFGVSLGLLLER